MKKAAKIAVAVLVTIIVVVAVMLVLGQVKRADITGWVYSVEPGHGGAAVELTIMSDGEIVTLPSKTATADVDIDGFPPVKIKEGREYCFEVHGVNLPPLSRKAITAAELVGQ